jgi:hypothetical protein
MKVRTSVIATARVTHLPGKSERALGKCRATDAAASLQPCPDEPQPLDDLEHVSRPINTIKTPLVLMLEEQQQERQGAQRKAGEATSLKSGHANNAAVKSTKSLAPHELDGSDADDSDVPLAKKHARRLCALSGPPKKKRRRADPVPKYVFRPFSWEPILPPLFA